MTLKRWHKEKVDSEADQDSESHDDQQVNEAASSEADEQHDD